MPAPAKAANCFFVTGSDEVGVKRAAKELAEKLAPGADAFGLEVIDGAVETVDAAVGRIEETIGALLTLPFLGGQKLVWLKNVAFLSDTQAGRSESVLAALDRLAATLEGGLPGGVQFLLSAVGPDKRRKAYSTLAKRCNTTVADLPDLGFRGGEEALMDWVAGEARRRGLHFDAEAVEVLAARVGLDAAQLASELDKLETAFGKATRIAAPPVRELVPQTREGGIFDLSGAILRRDLGLALATLAQLFRQGEKGVGILLAAIVPTVRNLLLVKDLMRRHALRPGGSGFAGSLAGLPASETSHLPRKKDGTVNAYPLGLAATHASNFTLEELTAGFRECAGAAEQLFSGALEDEVLLSKLLVGLLARA